MKKTQKFICTNDTRNDYGSTRNYRKWLGIKKGDIVEGEKDFSGRSIYVKAGGCYHHDIANFRPANWFDRNRSELIVVGLIVGGIATALLIAG